MPATFLQPIPSQWHSVPTLQEPGGLQGSPEPLVRGGFWSEGISWSVVQGCSVGNAQPGL